MLRSEQRDILYLKLAHVLDIRGGGRRVIALRMKCYDKLIGLISLAWNTWATHFRPTTNQPPQDLHYNHSQLKVAQRAEGGVALLGLNHCQQSLFQIFATTTCVCARVCMLIWWVFSNHSFSFFLFFRAAVEEGKVIYYNIRNFVRFQLSTWVMWELSEGLLIRDFL